MTAAAETGSVHQPLATAGGATDPGMPPLVSVIVVSHNERRTIGRCIESILQQDYSPIELIVVDDGSEDGTRELLADRPDKERYRVIELPQGGPSRARNEGVAAAAGELVAFFDADCWLHRSCLAALVAGLDPLPVVSCGGLQVAYGEENDFGQAVDRLFGAFGLVTDYLRSGAPSGSRDTDHNPSCNLLYRRRELEELGGFDEGLWPGEDVDVDRRASLRGFRHRVRDDAMVGHLRPGSPRALWRKMTAYGRAQGLLMRRYGLFRRLHYVVVVAALAALALAVGWLAMSLWVGVPFWWGLAVFFPALLLLEVWRSMTRQGWLVYVVGFVVVVGWLTGLLAEAIVSRFDPTPRLRDVASKSVRKS